MRKTKTLVYVARIGKECMDETLKLVAELWAAGIPTEMSYDTDPKPGKQTREAAANEIPYVIFVGKNEINEKQLKVKDLAAKKESAKKESIVARSDIVAFFVAKMKDMK